MARPMKKRRVCCKPRSRRFGPAKASAGEGACITMPVDEYEAIRLIDLEGMTQEECGEQMEVARSTVQSIYADARRKLADMLVNGKTLVIEGGEYRICHGHGGHGHGHHGHHGHHHGHDCGCGNHGHRHHGHHHGHDCGCHRKSRGECFAERAGPAADGDEDTKEGKGMKIAMPVDGDTPDSAVSASFGRAPYFMVHDTGTGENVFLDNAAAASSGGAGIKAAQAVADSGAKALLTPRIGENAAEVLAEAGVELYKSRPGTASENVYCFNNGELPKLKEISPGKHGHGN